MQTFSPFLRCTSHTCKGMESHLSLLLVKKISKVLQISVNLMQTFSPFLQCPSHFCKAIVSHLSLMLVKKISKVLQICVNLMQTFSHFHEVRTSLVGGDILIRHTQRLQKEVTFKFDVSIFYKYVFF